MYQLRGEGKRVRPRGRQASRVLRLRNGRGAQDTAVLCYEPANPRLRILKAECRLGTAVELIGVDVKDFLPGTRESSSRSTKSVRRVNQRVLRSRQLTVQAVTAAVQCRKRRHPRGYRPETPFLHEGSTLPQAKLFGESNFAGARKMMKWNFAGSKNLNEVEAQAGGDASRTASGRCSLRS